MGQVELESEAAKGLLAMEFLSVFADDVTGGVAEPDTMPVKFVVSHELNHRSFETGALPAAKA